MNSIEKEIGQKVPRFLNGTEITAGSNSTEDDGFVTSNDSDIIRESFRVYGSIYLVSLVLYSFLRRRFPKPFNIRSWVPEHECELAKNEYGFFSWFWEVFKVKDDDILEQCGLDVLCFIRAMRFGRRLSYIGCFVAVWLIPLYRTARECDETSYLTDPFVQISISNLCSSSPRYIGTVLAAYIVFGFTMYLLFEEFRWYTSYRHKFLSARFPRNYAIYVSGIPNSYRSSSELFNYFQNCTKGAVVEAHITMNIPSLEAKQARRQVVLERLEHAVALERKTGRTQTHRRCGWRRGVEKVYSVAEYEYELDNLNREIEKAVVQILNAEDPMRSQFVRAEASHDLLGALDFSGSGSNDEETEHCVLPRKNTGAYEYDSEMADLLAATPRKSSSFHAGSNSTPSSPTSFRKAILHSPPPVLDSSDSSLPDDIDELFDPEVGESSEGPDFPSLQSVPKDPLLNKSVSTESKLSRESGGILDEDNDGPRREHSSKEGATAIAPYEGLSNMTAGPDSDESLDIYGKSMQRKSGHTAQSSRQNESQSSSSSNKSINSFRGSLSGVRRSAGRSIASTSKVATQSIKEGSRAATQSLVAARQSIVAGSKAAQVAVIKATKDVNIEKFTKTAEEVAATSIKKAHVIGSQVVSSAGAVVPLLLNHTEGSPRTAGFVLFSDLYSVQSALQMVHHPKPYTMDVQEAPDPGDIFWRNVGLPHRSRRVGLACAITASAVLCFFWSIPTAFIASLTEVRSLKEELPRLGEWIDDHPRSEFFFEQLAPLLLLFINEVILPSILKHFAKWEGHVSAAMLEASLFVKLGVFMIIQTFFISAISGGISAELTNMLENPKEIIDLLANSLPAQSSYFIQILLASTFLLQALEFLRVYQLGIALLRRFIGPNLTKKERRKKWGWLNSLEDPPEFWHAETFAQILLYYVVFFVYATIAPVTSFFLVFCFVLLESGFRFQLIHNYPRSFDTGGRLYYSFIQFTLACMIIAQLTVVGLLVLKQNKYAGPALGPLIAITIIFIIFFNQKHSVVLRYLPSRDCVVVDHQNEDGGITDFSFVKGEYLQPALKTKRVSPEYDTD